jgi:hypothetical protein
LYPINGFAKYCIYVFIIRPMRDWQFLLISINEKSCDVTETTYTFFFFIYLAIAARPT